jgi:uncharacterized protein (TIGR02145 family)
MYLESSLGMPVADQETAGWRGINEGGALKATNNWNSPNAGATNSYGFTSLPGGFRYNFGPYNYIGNFGYWWSSTDNGSADAWPRELGYNYTNVLRNFTSKQGGFSVRCVRDLEVSPIQGCTDGSACNFLANATQDDGSCLYQNATCDDGDVNTANDVINSECVCAGTILPPPLYTMGNGVTDIDGNFYPSIIINGQEWMQKNLAVSKYRNGDPIPTGLSNTTWQNTTSGAYAVYNNAAANNTTYGKLYNWYAVNDSRGLCPAGWHVPSDAEWTTLINYLDPNAAGGDETPNMAGGKMKSITGWNSPDTGPINESGFSGLPGGYRFNDGTYLHIGDYGFWWSGTEFDSNFVWLRFLYYYNSHVNRVNADKLFGFSVRCLRD